MSQELPACLAGWLIIIFIKHQSKTVVFICMMWIGCLLVFMGKTFDLYPYPDNLSAYIYNEADNTKTAAGVLDKIHFMIMVFISFYCTFSAFFDHHAGIDRKNCLHTLLRPSWYLSSFFLFTIDAWFYSSLTEAIYLKFNKKQIKDLNSLKSATERNEMY